MAFRLDQAIVKGEIDNTERGRVRGLIWLLGRKEPLKLDLEGDAWRDVAGAKIQFVNPEPRRQKRQGELKQVQQGIVGDITASRKVKHITASDEEWQRCMEDDKPIPFEWRNSLYIEWFSEENGRVVIETTDFETQVTEFTWQMDEAEEQAQQFANLNAMRNWLATIIKRPEMKDDDDDDEAPLSEDAWEESLKLSDRVSEAHMEAMDKYGEDDDDETKVAFVMGWDHMLGMMADAQENESRASQAIEEESFEDEHETDEEGEEWKEDVEDLLNDDEDDFDNGFDEEPARERERHPLLKRSRELVLRVLRDLRDDDRDDAVDADEANDSPLGRFIGNTLNIGGKLAGALGSRRFAQGDEAGYTLAILKRCLNWANEALAGLNSLMADSRWEDKHPLFSEFKRELHAIRDGITDLRQEIRRANPGV